MSESPSSEEQLMGDNWRLPARPCPGSAGFELGSPSAMSSVSPSVSSKSLSPPPPSASSAPSASPPPLRWLGSVWFSSVLCKGGWCNWGTGVGRGKHDAEGRWEPPTLSEEGPVARMGNTNGFSPRRLCCSRRSRYACRFLNSFSVGIRSK